MRKVCISNTDVTTDSMVINKFLIFAVILFLPLTVIRAQDVTSSDLYQQTISFLKLLTYGERHEDIGLRFSWQQTNGRWVPKGNGFVFLSDGLGIYDYETNETMQLPPDGIWHIACGDEIKLTNDSLQPDNEGIVRFVADSAESTPSPLSLYIELRPMTSANDSIVPAKILSGGRVHLPDSNFDFTALVDKDDGALILRFLNLMSDEIQVYVDNSTMPASRLGICTQTILRPGETTVRPTVSTIDMKGHVSLPPFSLTLYKFATRHGKSMNSQYRNTYE